MKRLHLATNLLTTMENLWTYLPQYLTYRNLQPQLPGDRFLRTFATWQEPRHHQWWDRKNRLRLLQKIQLNILQQLKQHKNKNKNRKSLFPQFFKLKMPDSGIIPMPCKRLNKRSFVNAKMMSRLMILPGISQIPNLDLGISKHN